MRIFQWIAIAGMTLFFPLTTLAIDLGAGDLKNAGDSANINTAAAEGDLATLIGSIIGVVLSVLGVLLFIYFLYAGFLWMTAQGEPKKVQQARSIMGNAIVGLVITLSANSIVFFLSAELPGGELIWNQSTSDVEEAAGLIDTNNLIEDNIGALINVILNTLGVVLLLLFLYAGFLWMTAQGDGKQTQKARDIMRNATVGLIIVLLSQVLASFIINRLERAEIAHTPQIIHSTTIT